MTKEEFLDSQSFRIKEEGPIFRKGSCSYRLTEEGGRDCISLEVRSESTGQVILTDFEISVDVIDDLKIVGSRYIFGKVVNFEYYFSDLVVVEDFYYV